MALHDLMPATRANTYDRHILQEHVQQQEATHVQTGHREINVYKQNKKEVTGFQIGNCTDQNNYPSQALIRLLRPRFHFPFTPFPLFCVLVEVITRITSNFVCSYGGS
jgi:hypothetical protein